jgi:hypothetical protein
MDSIEASMPPSSAKVPRTSQSAASGHRSFRPVANHPQPNGNRRNRQSAISKETLKLEFPNAVYETLKEDLSKRAQARRLLWEFFD